jgi:hypothetical protein
MYRSDEIINLLYQINIPIEITKLILSFERKLSFDYELIEFKQRKILHELYYTNDNYLHYFSISFMLNDIELINGNLNFYLYKKKYKKRFKKNKDICIYINNG